MAVTRFRSDPRLPAFWVMSETTTRPTMTVLSPNARDSRKDQALWMA
jgi:hypothetical protein